MCDLEKVIIGYLTPAFPIIGGGLDERSCRTQSIVHK